MSCRHDRAAVWISEPSGAALASCSALLDTNTVTTAGSGLVLRSVVAVTVSVTSTSCDDGPSVHPRVEGEGRGCVEVGLRRGGVRIAVRGEELDIQNVVSWACAMRYGGATSGGWAARPWSGHAMVGRTVRRHRGFRPSSGAHQSVRAHRLPQALHLRVGVVRLGETVESAKPGWAAW